MQQVFDELERLYMEPQAELHEISIYEGIDVKGAQDIFDDAGVVVLSDSNIPEGEQYKLEWKAGIWDKAIRFFSGAGVQEMADGAAG